jgi:cyclopropane fatty-acyl-phospholipid synthase-like methyltransferase
MNNLVARIVPQFVKRAIWQRKYRRGYRMDQPADMVALLRQHARVLELGCGRGGMLATLRSQGWNGYYHGVDISSEALSFFPFDNNSKNTVSSIEDFHPHTLYDAIAFVESIYYLPLKRVQAIIERMQEHLSHDGIIAVRIHDHEKYREYIDILAKNPNVIVLRQK